MGNRVLPDGSVMDDKVWKVVRARAIASKDHVCALCGNPIDMEAPPKHPLSCEVDRRTTSTTYNSLTLSVIVRSLTVSGKIMRTSTNLTISVLSLINGDSDNLIKPVYNRGSTLVDHKIAAP